MAADHLLKYQKAGATKLRDWKTEEKVSTPDERLVEETITDAERKGPTERLAMLHSVGP